MASTRMEQTLNGHRWHLGKQSNPYVSAMLYKQHNYEEYK